MQQYDLFALKSLVGDIVKEFAKKYKWNCKETRGIFTIGKGKTYVGQIALFPDWDDRIIKDGKVLYPKGRPPYKVYLEHPDIAKELEKYLDWKVNRKLLREMTIAQMFIQRSSPRGPL